MKVLLVNPPAPEDTGAKMVREGRCMQRKGAWTAVWPPITLAIMAALLEKKGMQSKIIDAIVEDIGRSQLAGIIRQYKPDLIVINTATASIVSDLGVAGLAKKVYSKVKTAAFGIHVSALERESFKISRGLDYIARGEPELTILDLALRIKSGRSPEGVKGLTRRSKRRIFREKDRPFINNLDSLPFPAWDKLNLNNYRLPFSGKKFLLIGTGRGCPWSCRFCAAGIYYGKKIRTPSANKVVDDMEEAIKSLNINNFLFWSESFTMNKKFSLDVCKEIIKRKLNVKWVCNSRVDTVENTTLKLAKQAGCWMIGFGIESGNNKILALMNKGIRVSQIRKAVARAKQVGLEVTGHMMIGYPGETPATVQDTINLACSLDLDFVQFYTAVPFPGSQLYQMAKTKGFLNSDNWGNYEQNYSVMDTPGLSSGQTEKLRSRAYRSFYLRPKIIRRTFARIKSPRQLAEFIKLSLDFLKWGFR